MYLIALIPDHASSEISMRLNASILSDSSIDTHVNYDPNTSNDVNTSNDMRLKNECDHKLGVFHAN